MIRDLLESLANDWAPERPQKPLEAIKLAGSGGLSRKVNFLVFEKGSKNPTYLLRISRDKTFQSGLESEFQNLSFLSSLKNLKTSVPTPVGLFRYNQQLVLVETCLSGISLENLILRRGTTSAKTIRTELRLVQNWLDVFWQSTKVGNQGVAMDKTLDEGLPVLDESMTSRLRDELYIHSKSFREYRLPLVACHGDFWPGNIVLDGNQIGIMDWETLALRKSPLRDLFFFVTMYGMRHFSGTYIARFSSAFLRKNKVSSELSNMVRSLLKRLEIPPEFSSFLYVIFLLELATNPPLLERPDEKHSMWPSFIKEISSLRDLVL